MYLGRVGRVRERMEEAGLEALLITSYPNRRYLSGYRAMDTSLAGPAGWLLVSQREAYLLVGFNEYEMARLKVKGVELLQASDPLPEAMAALLKSLSWPRVGFEEEHLTFAQHQQLVAALADRSELVPARGIVESLRAVKDEEELAHVGQAAALADAAMDYLSGKIRPGITESQVAWEVEKFLREHGAEGVSFPPDIAAGPNGASPHAIPSQRPIQVGEPVIMDIGARVEGYCSDLTRSFCLGEADARFRELFALVKEAQAAALAAIRPGVTGQEVDAVARQIMAAAGYGQAFGHGLGHGLGLEVHEAPRLAKTITEPLAENMVVTLEPGIYLPGWGGLRLEDMVVVRPEGAEVLTKAPKEMVVSSPGLARR